MPTYEPITDIVPLASMVTGLAMPSALGNQMRDDLVAMYEGVWFIATGVGVTLVASTLQPILMDAITLSNTATAGNLIGITSGNVVTRLPGHWLIGGQYTASTTASVELLLDATDAPAAYVAETINDTATSKNEIAASAIVEVNTTPNTFTLVAFSGGTPAITDSSYSPLLWGVWLGELS